VRRSRKAALVLASIGAALSTVGSADALEAPDARDSAHPCRPTISCTADLTSPGTLEVEAGELASVASGGGHEASFPILLKQTLTPLVQLQVGSNGYTLLGPSPRTHYFDNVVFGPKLHVHDQDGAWPSLAVAAQLGEPTFAAQGYARSEDAFVTAFASKDVGAIHGDFNLGLDLWQLESTHASQVFAALALSTALSPILSIAVEGYVFSDAAPTASRDGGIRASLGFTARPWLVVDAGGDLGFYPATRAASVFLGATFIPAVWWRP
jgi:Putative MetA-pathway of phenol degradation